MFPLIILYLIFLLLFFQFLLQFLYLLLNIFYLIFHLIISLWTLSIGQSIWTKIFLMFFDMKVVTIIKHIFSCSMAGGKIELFIGNYIKRTDRRLIKAYLRLSLTEIRFHHHIFLINPFRRYIKVRDIMKGLLLK